MHVIVPTVVDVYSSSCSSLKVLEAIGMCEVGVFGERLGRDRGLRLFMEGVVVMKFQEYIERSTTLVPAAPLYLPRTQQAQTQHHRFASCVS